VEGLVTGEEDSAHSGKESCVGGVESSLKGGGGPSTSAREDGTFWIEFRFRDGEDRSGADPSTGSG